MPPSHSVDHINFHHHLFLFFQVGDYKYLIGAKASTGWGPNPSDPSSTPVIPDPKDVGPWLFNVRVDISERNNLYADPVHAAGLAKCLAALARYAASAVACRLCTATPDVNAAPKQVPGLNICTPSPVNESDMSYGSQPIMCMDLGVWQPWNDPHGP